MKKKHMKDTQKESAIFLVAFSFNMKNVTIFCCCCILFKSYSFQQEATEKCCSHLWKEINQNGLLLTLEGSWFANGLDGNIHTHYTCPHVTIFVKLKEKVIIFLFESHMFYFQLFEYPSCFHKPHMIKNLIQLFKLHKDTRDNICHIKRTHNYLF